MRAALSLLPLGALLLGSCTGSSDPDSRGASPDAADTRDGPRNIFVGSLQSECLVRTLPVNGDRISCSVMEAVRGQCSCELGSGRKNPGPDFVAGVQRSLLQAGVCGGSTGIACTEFCVCELVQLEGADLTGCQNDINAAAPSGFCYVDPQAGLGNPELVADCPDGQKRKLRFLGATVPQAGALRFIGCAG